MTANTETESALPPIQKAPESARPRIAFRAFLAALETVEILKKKDISNLRMLDIGGGHGVHADFFAEFLPGITIDIVDMTENDPRTVFVGDYLDFEPDQPYDVIWASHVMEHVRNTGLFLDKVMEDLADGGIFVCTVPPHRQDRGILAHLTTWDPMLLIINLVRAGFDAKDGHFAKYRYNVSGIVTKRSDRLESSDGARMPKLKRLRHTYVADFRYYNWKSRKVSDSYQSMLRFSEFDEALRAYQSGAETARFFCVGEETMRSTYYFDRNRRYIMETV